MGKGGGGKIQVTDYYMSMHHGICYGHGDVELLAIYAGEKEAWTGSVTTQQDIDINRPDLHGGPKKEGGVSGLAHWLPGGPTQVIPDRLAQKVGLMSTTCPAYRGIASIWFYGRTVTGTNSWIGQLFGRGNGFMWASNNPYLKAIAMKVRVKPVGLPPETAMIASNGLLLETDHNLVTIDGVSTTVMQGALTEVNGHYVTLSGNSLTLDGTVISVNLTDKTLTVGGLTGPMGNGVTTLGNYTVATPSYYMDGEVKIANLRVTQAGGQIDANPVHIIYECLVDQEWGQGGAPTGIDYDSFVEAASTIYSEGFGISIAWKKQTSVETFVSEILDHIQATMFVNPRTGKMTIKLIRADYDRETLPVLNRFNCRITKFDRKAWGETVNEIVVTWTNPDNEKEETVAAQNNANIAIQGGIISDSRNYYGVRNVALAMRLAHRDLAMSSLPLAAFEIEADRGSWDLVPGGCVRLDYPEYNIDDVVVRLGKIDYGKPGAPAIKLSAVEDIFALASADYDLPDDTQWEDPSTDPAALAYSRIMTAPAYFVTKALSAANLSVLNYPEVLPAVLASQNDNDTYSYDLYGEKVLSNGSTVAELVGNRPLLGSSNLPTALPAEAMSTVPNLGTLRGGGGPRPSGFIFIGNVTEQGHEIALIQAVTEDGYVLKRGVFDTVPRAWPSGTLVWYVAEDTQFLITSRAHSASETARYRLVPYTSRGVLPINDAPVLATALTARPHLPNRPANVVVGGTAFGSIDLSGSSPTVVTVTWANRNRTMEDGVVPTWTDANVVPESGQTTTIRLYSTTGTLLTSHTGLTGTTFDIPIASFGSEEVADVRVSSARDGLESLQFHTVRVKVGGAAGDPGNPDTGTPPDDPDPGPDFPEPPPWDNGQAK